MVGNGAATLAERIDALLPQTQCTKCGYAGCRPYADAIATGKADINQCPPGGDAGVAALAQLLNAAPKPINPANGVAQTVNLVAFIHEDECIGCTKCIQACPVDAILGAGKLMHTVIADECSGCELCIAPCPVDCIDLLPVLDFTAAPGRASQYRRRFTARQIRLQRQTQQRAATLARKKAVLQQAPSPEHAPDNKPTGPQNKDPLAAAVALAQARAAARQQERNNR